LSSLASSAFSAPPVGEQSSVPHPSEDALSRLLAMTADRNKITTSWYPISKSWLLALAQQASELTSIGLGTPRRWQRPVVNKAVSEPIGKTPVAASGLMTSAKVCDPGEVNKIFQNVFLHSLEILLAFVTLCLPSLLWQAAQAKLHLESVCALSIEHESVQMNDCCSISIRRI
jgi:hypothetical protein